MKSEYISKVSLPNSRMKSHVCLVLNPRSVTSRTAWTRCGKLFIVSEFLWKVEKVRRTEPEEFPPCVSCKACMKGLSRVKQAA